MLTCLLRPHAHRVDNFQVTSAWLAAAAASYPVHLTLNRQEYYPTNQSFSYRRPPVVSAVLPASGPLAGGTRVVITGTNLGGGTHYKCRFGGVPPGLVPPRGSEPLAQFITDAELLGADADADAALIPLPFGATFGASRVACFAPNASVVGDAVVTLELSLNGQDYTADGVSFTRHAPGLDRIYPSSGPHLGFAVELSGADLANGTRYRCRFQAPHLAPAERVVADAALDVAAVAGGREGAHGAVACTVPTGLSTVVHDVSVSLNAQQFTPSGWVDGLQGEVMRRSSNSVYLVVNCTGEAPVAWARLCTGPTKCLFPEHELHRTSRPFSPCTGGAATLPRGKAHGALTLGRPRRWRYRRDGDGCQPHAGSYETPASTRAHSTPATLTRETNATAPRRPIRRAALPHLRCRRSRPSCTT